MRSTGTPLRTATALRARSGRLELDFSVPLSPEAADPSLVAVHRWNWVRSAKYGSPEFSVKDPKKQGRDPVDVPAARLSEDGRTLVLEVPDLAPVMGLRVRLRLPARDGGTVSEDVHATIHRLGD